MAINQEKATKFLTNFVNLAKLKSAAVKCHLFQTSIQIKQCQTCRKLNCFRQVRIKRSLYSGSETIPILQNSCKFRFV